VICEATYDSCYSKREYSGDAAMGCCSGLAGGDKSIGNLQYPCITCPHYVDVLQISKQISKKINEDISELMTKTLKGE
jgi:hypothetical protein